MSVPTDNQPEFFPIIPDTTAPTSADPLAARDVIDPNNPPWGLGGALTVLISSIALQLFFSLLFFIPYALSRGLNPTSPDFGKELTEFALTDKTAILLQVLALLPAHLLSFGIVWVVVTRFGKKPFLASLGWRWSHNVEIVKCVGLAFLLFGAAWGIAWLLGTEKQTALEQIINSSVAARYSIAALAVFTAPFVEEFIYRGVLYSALQRLVGVTGAVVIVLGIFTLIHVPQYWPNFGVIAAIGLLSIVLTIIRAYTGRLLPCVLIHFVFNGIQSVILLLEPLLPRLGPAPEPTTSLVLILVRSVL
ncbi:MAG: CPBP family intramembrane glutamic endopeptidase [Pyrinomonadaceae bacterium]